MIVYRDWTSPGERERHAQTAEFRRRRVRATPRTARSRRSIDPSTGEVFAEAPVSGPADVDRALRAAAEAFTSWRRTTPSERSLALIRIADALEARAEDLVRAECENTGKPFQLTMDEEIPPMVDQIRFFAGAARHPRGPGGGRVHGRPHLVHPPRADRRVRRGDPVELPDDDGGLEVRSRAGRRQHAWCSSRRTPRR